MSVYRTIGPTLVVKFYDDFSNNDRKNPLLSHYFFIFFGTKAKWNKLATCRRKCPLQYEPHCEKSGLQGF